MDHDDTFLTSLAEVAVDPLIVAPADRDNLREARGNMWSFSVSSAQARRRKKFGRER